MHGRCLEVADAFAHAHSVYGVPRGGAVPAAIVASILKVPQLDELDEANEAVLVVDDLVESGRTAARFTAHTFVALWAKPCAPDRWKAGAVVLPDDEWVVFPWERDETPAADAVVRLGQAAGVDLAPMLDSDTLTIRARWGPPEDLHSRQIWPSP